MTSGRKPVKAATLLIILMEIPMAFPLTCRPAEYEIADRCCPMCPAGRRVDTDCIGFRNTSCLPCLDGSYLPKPTGRTRCYDCANCDTDSGLKVKSSCSATSDTVCEPLEGFYCIDSTDAGCVKAQKHRHCEPGQYISQKGTASTDTECSDCSNGTFSDGTLTSCQPHTQCESLNLQLITAGNSSADAQCGGKSSNIYVVVHLILFLFLLITTFGLLFYFRKKLPCLKTDKNTKQELKHLHRGCGMETRDGPKASVEEIRMWNLEKINSVTQLDTGTLCLQ